MEHDDVVGKTAWHLKLSIALAVAFGVLPASARAEPAGCFLAVGGRVMLDGPCQADLSRDGGFSFDMMDSKGAAVSVSIFAEAGGATGLLNVVMGGETSYQSLGPLQRAGRCWTQPRVRVCAWPAIEAHPPR